MITISQAATVLGMPESFVEKLVEEGELPVAREITFSAFTVPLLQERHVLAYRDRESAYLSPVRLAELERDVRALTARGV